MKCLDKLDLNNWKKLVGISLDFSPNLWYNSYSVGQKKKKVLEVQNMYNEETFNFNIENIQNDLAIEGMAITSNDVEMFRRFASEEMAMPELIQMIKSQPIEY